MKGREVHEYRIYKEEGKHNKYYNEYYSDSSIKRYFDFSKASSDCFQTREEAEAKISEIDPCSIMRLSIDEETSLWPCPQIDEDYHVGIRRWVEICEKAYNWFLECMPPIYHGDGYGFMINGVFLNSEESSHTKTGEGVYIACLEHDKKFYSMLMTIKEWKSGKFTTNLSQWGIEDGIPNQIQG